MFSRSTIKKVSNAYEAPVWAILEFSKSCKNKKELVRLVEAYVEGVTLW